VCELYVDLLTRPKELVAGEIFNAAYQNQTVSELAEIVREVVEQEFPGKKPIRIERTSTNDPRSYHVSSKKIADKLGWHPKRNIQDAVCDLCRAFKTGKFPGNTLADEQFINVKTVKKLGLR
jgi:nucleoside-diphosphate-sugar epimerase